MGQEKEIKCDCFYHPPKEDKKTERRKDDSLKSQIHLGVPRTVIAMMLASALIGVCFLIVLGYAQEMGETETYLVVTVLTILSTNVGNMINAIFGVKGDHHLPPTGRR